MRQFVVSVVFVLAASACGVPSQSEPHVIRDAALPPEPATSRPTTPAVVDARVYFVRGDRPVAVLRPAAGTRLLDALDALEAGPTDAEVAGGVRSALPAEGEVGVVAVHGGVATLEVSSLLDGVTGEEQILVFAQLVLTATGVTGIDAVVFQRHGHRIDAPTVDGTLVARPVSAADYAPLLDPPQ